MKKLYFLFIIITSSPIFAQAGLTYSVDVDYYRFASGCDYTNVPSQTRKTCDVNNYTWNLKNGTTNILGENITSTALTSKTYSIPLLSSYNLSAQVFCSCSGGVPSVPYYVCSESASQTILANGYTYQGVTTNNYGIESSIMTGGYAGGYSMAPNTQVCIGTVIVKNFKPNGLVISKPGYDLYPAGVYTPPKFIAGEQLNLIVTPGVAPNKFPDVAYHWQYSLDNKVTWIDVPIRAGKTMTNSPNPSFSIEDMLGTDHINHFGPIDFRLGYNNRPFTDTYRIIYSPGTVLLKDRTYVAPDCYKDDVKSLVAYFDRKLEDGEILSILQIIPYPKTNGDTPLLKQPSVTALTYDANTGLYKYVFNIPPGTNLENRQYVIEYQSEVNGVPRGTLAIGAPFAYQNPDPVKFDIKPALNPLCHDDTVEIAISVIGGTGLYKFYVDGVEKTPTPAKEGDGFYHIRGLNPSAINNIKVVDTNGCIEKNNQ